MSSFQVIFVCLGNICRSPMAERLAEQAAQKAGVNAVFTSAGVSDEEAGNPIDSRAKQVLAEAGCRIDNHQAHKITAAEILAADLVIAVEAYQKERMQSMAPSATHIRLLTDFDPDAAPGSPVPDPWYGGINGFYETLNSINSALPMIIETCKTGKLPESKI